MALPTTTTTTSRPSQPPGPPSTPPLHLPTFTDTLNRLSTYFHYFNRRPHSPKFLVLAQNSQPTLFARSQSSLDNGCWQVLVVQISKFISGFPILDNETAEYSSSWPWPAQHAVAGGRQRAGSFTIREKLSSHLPPLFRAPAGGRPHL